MSGFILIDRRKNSHGKSLSNRQRFLERAKKAIRESAKKALSARSITSQKDVDISVPTEGLNEPHFRNDPEVGDYDYVLPGNDEYVVGDIIQKPRQGQSRGKGAGEGGDGEDEFSFALSYEEYLDVIFDDLELPDLIKQSEKNAVAMVNRRAGHTNAGIPSNLNIERTAVAGISRRIALRAPKMARIRELEEELAALQNDYEAEAAHGGEEKARTAARIAALEDEITSLRAKARAISFLDNVDLRYNNFVKQPRPITQAVMFCVMDVSGSMGEREKVISKKFFVLLHLFLQRRYKNIDVVFIRHHDTAMECDEETFFTSRESGGTIVSSAYEEAKKIISARYPTDDWNIYVAQASDGDNWDDDNANVYKLLDEMLPGIQHMVYIEIKRVYAWFGLHGNNEDSNLMQTLRDVNLVHPNLSLASIENERDVVKVFRDLFKKDQEA